MAIYSRYKLKTGQEVDYFPPIQNTDSPYLTEAAMHADQANQLEGYGYLVDGVGAFTYLGTLAGTAADYEAFGGASAVPKEHQINGIRINASVATSYAIDWNAGSVFVLTMTANTTFSNANLPTGVNAKIITIELTGAFAPTFPANWTLKPSTDAYDGVKNNLIEVNCLNGTAAAEKIYYHNELTT